MGNVNYDTEMIQLGLKQYGLNWTVKTEEIQTKSGIVIPKRVALVREDTSNVLGIHTNDYELFQNHELLELLYDIKREKGMTIHSGGFFGNGEKVWFQLGSGGSDHELKLGGDKVIGYVSGINSFDGSTSLALGNMSFTISCRNTFWKGYKLMDTKIRHSSTLRIKVDEILRKIDILMEEEQDMFKKIRIMDSFELTQEVRDMVVRKLFDLEREETLETALVNPEISTRKKNLLSSFMDDMVLETSTKGDTLWGMFSSVTRFTTHSMKKTDNTQSKMIGVTGLKEREIWNELVSYI